MRAVHCVQRVRMCAVQRAVRGVRVRVRTGGTPRSITRCASATWPRSATASVA